MNGLSWIGIINLLGTIQAVLFFIIFLTQEKNRKANCIIAFLCLSFALTIGGTVLGALGYYKLVPYLIRIGDPFALAIPPLIYFYTREICGRTVTLKDCVHLVPFVIYVLILIPFYKLPAGEKIAAVENIFDAPKIAPFILVIAVVRLLSSATYVFLSILQVRDLSNNLKNTYSSPDLIGLGLWEKILGWLSLLVVIQVALFILLAGNIFSFLETNIFIGFVTTLMLYSMVWIGWKYRSKAGTIPVPGNQSPEMPGPSQPVIPKYESSGMTKEDIEEQAAALKFYMEDQKPFTEPDLSLNKLASLVNLSPHQVSQVINQGFNQNFFDFINQSRVQEVVRLMQMPENSSYTILSLAFEAGFNSKSTFNQAFKKHTGQTPSEFKKSL